MNSDEKGRMSDYVQPYGDRGAFQCLPYDPRALDVFRCVASLIVDADESLVVEHVGSTAVPGCPGKGFIDVLVLAPTQDYLMQAPKAVEGIGFTGHDFGQGYPGARGLVRLDGTDFRVHIQIAPRDSAKAREMLAFRDLLRCDPDLLARYAERKQQLIDAGIDRNPEYTSGKNDLIRDALRKARFESLSQ
jgi:GrpB-like predicted nucleotidyltransferase (UPF0157 family)